MKQILLVYVKITARSHTQREKSKLVIRSGESGVNPVAVNTDVFPVSNVREEDHVES